jgi:hypothetical protein
VGPRSVLDAVVKRKIPILRRELNSRTLDTHINYLTIHLSEEEEEVVVEEGGGGDLVDH